MTETKFVGRISELKSIRSLVDKRAASLITLSGRRRVGKSRLAEVCAKDKVFYQFSGLPPTVTTSAQDQRNEFARQLSEQTNLPNIKTDDWGELFTLLAQKTYQEKTLVLFDEITWMAQNDRNFLGKLK